MLGRLGGIVGFPNRGGGPQFTAHLPVEETVLIPSAEDV